MGRHDDLDSLSIRALLFGLLLKKGHQAKLSLRMKMRLRLLDQQQRKAIALGSEQQ